MATYLDDLNMTPQQRGLTNPSDIAARNAYDTANAPKINLSTPIDAGKLFQPTANLGTYTPPDTASKVLTTSSAYNDLINQQNTAATEAKTNLNTSTNALSSLKEKLGLQSTRQAELNQEAGLPQRNADYNNYTNDINSINAGIDKRLKDLETNLRAQGVPAAGIENEKNKVKLETAQLLTQKEIARSVAGNDITRLQASIKDQLALEFDPIKAKLEAEQIQFEANKDLYSTAQQQAWQVQFQAKKDEVDQAEQEKKGINDMLTKALSDGVKIPPDLFAEASKSGSLTEALTLLNNNGIQLGDQLDRAYKQAQIAKLYQDISDSKKKNNPEGGLLSQAQSKGNIDLISNLANDKYLSTAVGPNSLSRVSFSNVFTGGKSNFIAGVEQLKSQLTLDSLINAKARGATFGALSEGELKTLSASATKLGTWAQKDSKGNVIGYNVSEADFKKEMDKINNFAKLDYLLKGGNADDVGAKILPDKTVWVKNSDGSYTQLK